MIDKTELKKAASLIEETGTVFVALPEEAPVDAVAAAALIAGRLTGLGKTVMVSRTNPLPPKWEFLSVKPLTSHAQIPQDVVITIDTKSSPVGELRYEKGDEALTIILSPKDKPIRVSDIKIGGEPAKADCVIVVGAETLETLGALYDKNPRLFFETPVINIDISPANNNFGEVNLVNPKARALTEISSALAKAFLPQPLSADEATLALAGILANTKNFLDGKVLPETLSLAAEAIASGAKRDLILRAVEERRPLPILQLWGRAAFRSRYDEDRGILISIITADDFIKTGTTPDAIGEVARLFETHLAPPKIFLILQHDPVSQRISAILQSRDFELAKELSHTMFGNFERGLLRLRETFPSFREAESGILATLDSLKTRTGRSNKENVPPF